MIQKVQIVRGRVPLPEAIGNMLSMFVKAWLVMLLLPVAISGLTEFTPAYWQALALVLVVDTLFHFETYSALD